MLVGVALAGMQARVLLRAPALRLSSEVLPSMGMEEVPIPWLRRSPKALPYVSHVIPKSQVSILGTHF